MANKKENAFMGDFGLAEQYAMRGARIGGE